MLLSPSQQVDLISALGISFDANNRMHFASAPIKALYYLYNLAKGYEDLYPGAETIAENIGLKRDEVSKFVNSPEFKKYAVKYRRRFTSNQYHLLPWLVDCFRALERLGLMKGFRSNFKAWRKAFKKRLGKLYCSKLIHCETWSDLFDRELLMTRLSTKKRDRPGMEKRDRPGTTRYSSSLQVEKKKNGFSTPSKKGCGIQPPTEKERLEVQRRYEARPQGYKPVLNYESWSSTVLQNLRREEVLLERKKASEVGKCRDMERSVEERKRLHYLKAEALVSEARNNPALFTGSLYISPCKEFLSCIFPDKGIASIHVSEKIFDLKAATFRRQNAITSPV